MNESKPTLITAREAEAFVPPLSRFAGNYQVVAKLLGWLKRPVQNDANLLIEGDPGTGKTSLIIAYLREQFGNPFFYREEHSPDRAESKARGEYCPDTETAREWQDASGEKVFFKQIDGATDSETNLRNKIEQVRYADAAHKVALVDEVGEAYFRGLDETLRPMLTDAETSVYATAQNFHSKRKAETSKEEDHRLSALIRRFSHREKTECPTEPDHLRFVAYLVGEWGLRVDQLSTLRLLVEKSNGIVGYTKRALIKAIDEPDRRLTRGLVETSDIDPLG